MYGQAGGSSGMHSYNGPAIPRVTVPARPKWSLTGTIVEELQVASEQSPTHPSYRETPVDLWSLY